MQHMPEKMYTVKPFYDSSAKVDIPSVMYSVKNFHESSPYHKIDASINLDPISALEVRQEKILTKLAELRQTLDALTGKYQVKDALKASTPFEKSASAQSLSAKITSPLGSGIHDIVINADPSSPPLILFVLFEMLKQNFRVLATTYIHSSVVDVNPRLCEIIKDGAQATRGKHDIALSVVWKKVENGPQLMVSPAKQSVVSGEVNIARYINRLINPAFDSEDIVMATNWDEWFDVADAQLLNGNSKQRTAAVKNLNARLKRNDWIAGSEFSLVDAVMWSALHQSQQASTAPENLQKWLKACSAISLFKNAMTLL